MIGQSQSDIAPASTNRPDDGPCHYQATYRKSELVIPGLLVILAVLAALASASVERSR